MRGRTTATATVTQPVTAALVILMVAASVVFGLTTVRAEAAAAPRTATGQNSQIVFNVSGTLSGMSTSPGTMSPGFATGTTDYAIWCTQTGANPLNLTLSGTNLTYESQSGSTVTIAVSPEANEAIVVAMNGEAASSGLWIRCLPPGFPQLGVTMNTTTPTPGYYITGTIVDSEYAMVSRTRTAPRSGTSRHRTVRST